MKGHWNNVTVLEPIETLLKEDSCCITKYNPASYQSSETCKASIRTYRALFAVIVIGGVLVVAMVLENFHHGLTKGRLIYVANERITSFINPAKGMSCSCDHPLTLSTLDYCTWGPWFAVVLTPTLFVVVLIVGPIYLDPGYTTTYAFMHNCTVYQQPTWSNQGNLTNGLQCLGEIYLKKIHSYVSWNVSTAPYLTPATAESLLLQYENSQQLVFYYNDYNEENIRNGTHFHTLFDSSYGDVLFNGHKKYIKGIDLLVIPTGFVLLFAIVREIWRQKLKYDYYRDMKNVRVGEHLPLVPERSESERKKATKKRKEEEAQERERIRQEREADKQQEKERQEEEKHQKMKEKDENKKQNEAGKTKEEQINVQYSGPSYTNYPPNNSVNFANDSKNSKNANFSKEEQINVHYSGPSYTNYSNNSNNSNNTTTTTTTTTSPSENYLCGICTEHRMNTVLNCGHALCRTCSLQVADCPFCKVPITERKQLFI
eukprot:Phypoly_transcript_03446.p1 GENE.Phypoly_transcript_03446~~Phypoly_transcript_03446.p1  ORF type:complete len:487 (+),score=69.39 Phypoly_transcript_03446:921-2381(+)